MKRAMLILVAVVAGVISYWFASRLPPLDSPSLTRDQFAQHFDRMLRETLPTSKIVARDGLERDLVFSDTDMKIHVALDNAWARSAQEPQLRRQTLQDLVASIGEHTRKAAGAMDEPVKLSSVLPIVRHVDYIQAASGKSGGKFTGVVEPLADDLRLLYVQDLPKTTRVLSADDLVKMKVTLEALRAAAFENLRVKAKTVKWIDKGDVHALYLDGDFESSLLAWDEFWQSDAPIVDGELVMIVPARGEVIVTGSRSTDNVAALRKLAADDYATLDHPISKSIYIRCGGKWVKQ